ncbi:site-specific DNA-methyltransferase [Aliarcobacter cryaerophilus]|uniref:site-specific DNA-methyltransferase n=1 Tax=Aliarcobacter cryaerophilus TaxID=28198 RepID=UPI0021B630A5|nr:site-specific DNA-methyltransferase [Aliarcobacter cryaerophilus]MCT7519087.1 site-specific DNA-methyltransferase [Aliarcobacter cryaerophilus]
MLTKEQKDYIIHLLQEDKEIPQEFKYDLFPTIHKEYELTYAGKIRKEDLLANEDGVYPVPIQIEKVFNGNKFKSYDDEWKNMIVIGDNLQFLKTINENKDPLIKDKIKGKVKLIYIDPPFATENDFKGGEGQKAYSDKAKGADFIEFLRRRLILAREILADDGSLFVHLDTKKGHYIKIILDEIFGEGMYRNEIIWTRSSSGKTTSKNLSRDTDCIYWYTKSEQFTFNKVFKPLSKTTLSMYNKNDNDGRGNYRLYPLQKTSSPGPETTYDYIDNNGNIWKCPKKGWRMKESKLKDLENDNRLYFEGKSLQEKAYWIERENEGREANNLWEDIANLQGATSEITGYPTQKPEKLIERILTLATNKNDIVLDFFGGSGTTISTAEKMERKWITCDIGKLSYFTIQKRILQIENSKDLNNSKKKYNKKAKSFITCSLGLYDLKKTLNMEWNSYKQFASSLFELELNSFSISGFEFEAKKNGYPVKIFDYNKFKDSSVDELYLKNIHQLISNKSYGRVYIIAPANSIDFLSDYFQIGNIRYYFLKIPYHMIKELHKTPFQKLRQPQSLKRINEVDEAVGFYFIRQPEVKSEIIYSNDKVILKLREFKSQYSKDEDGRYLENFETLSAIFIDKNYNNETFEMDISYFADELLSSKRTNNIDIRDDLKSLDKTGLQLEFNKNELGKKIMIVYTDIFGNDFTETFDIKGL